MKLELISMSKLPILNVLLKPKLIHKLTIPATRSRQVVQFVSSTWHQRPRLLSATEVIFSVGVARRRWRWRTVSFVELVDSQWTEELLTWKVTWNISSTDQEYAKQTVNNDKLHVVHSKLLLLPFIVLSKILAHANEKKLHRIG